MRPLATSKFLVLLVLTNASSVAIGICVSSGSFRNVSDSYLCIKTSFVQNITGIADQIICAFMCINNKRCQAFTMADGPCQLFVFDSCSKSVRDSSCSRRGQVFVRRQPGLEAGRLCPSGYGDDLYGVKYKLHSGSGLWSSNRKKCESESGLVIMADVIDATEMAQVDMLYEKYSNGSSFWLGGFQAPGSSEPAGGWYWVACNFGVDRSLWGTGEPDNKYGFPENAIGRWSNHPKLSDFTDYSSSPQGVLCECVSPFD